MVIKMVANSLQLNEWKEKATEEVFGGKCVNFELQNLEANTKMIIIFA